MVNETSTDIISKGNFFCLADTIHRYPPTLGLDSNTCIQDSFNLAWKVAYMLPGLAPPSLLETYSGERQRLASGLVLDSNNTLRSHAAVCFSVGVQPHGISDEDRKKAEEMLRQNSTAGIGARKALRESTRHMQTESKWWGTAMNQLYASTAICTNDEENLCQPGLKEQQDPCRFHDTSAYSGRRFPYVWLGSRVPGKLVSTLEVASKGEFTLLTGIGGGGGPWKAADLMQRSLNIEVKIVGIGTGLQWEDVYLEWEEKPGVEEDGCVLMRPDLFVAWISKSSGNESARLLEVMCRVLGVS
ncbi:uncharacterized protein M421DRAFT_418167 [Didymella exigua CBS 183.55]|uniref:FAD-binding domain-containing protein n=1 Tax=Didymella exigua CBS 183.55 TaxID=1150837 RepID=A0A6A5RUM6_9PLEO|nr:uncharacterized protein M421DRAFT_418167 [Didymella exigua CBS 183.55]KAF1930688.1 hypothetical protein M421DRAFT_418167 [Didymella exigua CBS 183.55]